MFLRASSQFLPRIATRGVATETKYVPIRWQPFGGKGWIAVSSVAAVAGIGFMFMNSDKCPWNKKPVAPLGSLPMSPEEFRAFPLDSIHKVNHNTSIFRFALPDKQKPLEMTPSSFVVTRKPTGDERPDVIRPYTPTSTSSDFGFFDLLVKVYPEGPMSSHIHSLKPGDLLDIKGPITKFDIFKAPPHDHFAMVAGGTGITPMLQIVNSILSPDNTKQVPKMTLVFGNVSEDDILLKPELDALAKKHPDKLKLLYIVDKPKNAAAWSGPVGYVTKDLLKKHLPSPTSGKVKVFVCGPPPMVASICGPKAPDYSQGELSGILRELGYTPDQVFKF